MACTHFMITMLCCVMISILISVVAYEATPDDPSRVNQMKCLMRSLNEKSVNFTHDCFNTARSYTSSLVSTSDMKSESSSSNKWVTGSYLTPVGVVVFISGALILGMLMALVLNRRSPPAQGPATHATQGPGPQPTTQGNGPASSEGAEEHTLLLNEEQEMESAEWEQKAFMKDDRKLVRSAKEKERESGINKRNMSEWEQTEFFKNDRKQLRSAMEEERDVVIDKRNVSSRGRLLWKE